MLIVEAHTASKGEVAQLVARLVVECHAVGVVLEVAAKHKVSCVPRNGVGGHDVVAVPLNQLADALVLKGNGRIHIVVAVKTESAKQPAICPCRCGASHDVFGHGVLFSLLREGEVRIYGEILVERHIVVEILVAGDAAYREVLIIPLNGQTVENAGAAIEAGVVVGNHVLAQLLVGVAALTAVDKREHIAHKQVGGWHPLHFHARSGLLFPVGFLTVVRVAKFAVGGIVQNVERDAQIVSQLHIVACPDFVGVVRTVLNECSGAGVA